MTPASPPRLAHLAAVWQRALGPWRTRTMALGVFAALVVAAHVARLGTFSARAGATMAVAGLALAWLGAALHARRLRRDPVRTARLLAGKVDKELGERAARAVKLATSPEQQGDPLTAGLAALHLDRLLRRVQPEHIWEAAGRSSNAWQRVALLSVGVGMAAVVVGPMRVLEGWDVWLAYRGEAPIAFDWLDAPVLQAQPPRYLQQREGLVLGLGTTAQPRGTVLSIHGHETVEGRNLLLTDGTAEVPFVKDGRGGVVARYTLGDSTELRVAARFGDVLIAQEETLLVSTIEDEAPQVVVEDTPRTLRAMEVSEIPLAYEVSDDHGLTQVDLVLRAGEREDRRVLSRPDGQTRFDRGSAVLRSDDRFVERLHVPIEIVIEARDNDPIRGPKWGRSKAVVLIPPAVGEAEAMRCEALRELRSAAVDVLARRLTTDTPAEAKALAAVRNKERTDHERLDRVVRSTMDAAYGGLGVPRRLAALYRGQMDRLHKVVSRFCPAGAPASSCSAGYRKLQDASELTVLAFDGALRALADMDAAKVSVRLADVAEDAAVGAKLSRAGEPMRGAAKLQAALTVLGGGARSLARLEGLGRDLNEVVEIGVRRIERTLSAKDLLGAELAARDLAGRLRRPHPSFGGGGGRHGTEAGGGAPLDDSSAGEEMQESFDAKGAALDELAREHAEEMENLQRALADAMREADSEASREQAREHARRLRRAVAGLPTHAMEASSVDGAAAVMRENAERMAEALDRVGYADAERAGENALRAAEEARRMAQGRADLFGQPPAASHAVERARPTVEEELRWVREQMEQAKRAAAERAGEDVRRSAGAEQELAERAKRLAEQGGAGEAPLPRDTVEMLRRAERAMRDAAQALRGADTERGMARQREGQRLLDMARESQREDASQADAARGQGESEQDEQRKAREERGNGRQPATGRVDIPAADAFRGPEEFRKRVVKGLSEPGDPQLRDAVRRYAEGLLR